MMRKIQGPSNWELSLTASPLWKISPFSSRGPGADGTSPLGSIG
ncbi:hypothetical protein [Rhodococcus sp. ARC_M6]|nr:hypothetical protein [Rhodococcus sp. ARC_M6]